MEKHEHVLRMNIGKQNKKSIQCFIQKSNLVPKPMKTMPMHMQSF